MAVLEQSASLGPLPGVLATLTSVAMVTTQHEVRDIISRDIGSCYTAQRKGMFNLVKILTFDSWKLRETTSSIIAPITLAFQLLLNLCCRMGTKYRLLSSTTQTSTSTVLFKMVSSIAIGMRADIFSILCLINLPSPLCYLTLSANALATYNLFSICLIVGLMMPFDFICMGNIIGSLLGANLLKLFSVVALAVLFSLLSMLSRISSAFLPVFLHIVRQMTALASLFFMRPSVFFATLIFSFLVRFVVQLTVGSFLVKWHFSFTANFTGATKTILTSFLRVKVFRSSGKSATTRAFTLLLGRVWGYNIIHGTTSNVVSSLRGALTPLGHTTLLPPQYTINPHQKLVFNIKGGSL